MVIHRMLNTKTNFVYVIYNLCTPPSCAIGFSAVAIVVAAGRLHKGIFIYIIYHCGPQCFVLYRIREQILYTRVLYMNESMGDGVCLLRCVCGWIPFFFVVLCYCCGCSKTNWAIAKMYWKCVFSCGWRFSILYVQKQFSIWWQNIIFSYFIKQHVDIQNVCQIKN